MLSGYLIAASVAVICVWGSVVIKTASYIYDAFFYPVFTRGSYYMPPHLRVDTAPHTPRELLIRFKLGNNYHVSSGDPYIGAYAVCLDLDETTPKGIWCGSELDSNSTIIKKFTYVLFYYTVISPAWLICTLRHRFQRH